MSSRRLPLTRNLFMPGEVGYALTPLYTGYQMAPCPSLPWGQWCGPVPQQDIARPGPAVDSFESRKVKDSQQGKKDQTD